MENEKDPSQEVLGDSMQEVSDSKLEEGAAQHEDELRRYLDTDNWTNMDLMTFKDELKSCNEAVKQLDENIRIIGSTRIDSDLTVWKNVGQNDWAPHHEIYRRSYDRKQYVSESLAELEKQREKLIRELEHRRDDFRGRAASAEEMIEKAKLKIEEGIKDKHGEELQELQNAKWQPTPAKDGDVAPTAPAEENAKDGDSTPAVPAEEPTKE